MKIIYVSEELNVLHQVVFFCRPLFFLPVGDDVMVTLAPSSLHL